MKTERLDVSKLHLLVEQGLNRWTVKIEDYLPYAGIESVNQISEIETSTYFPPAKYSNTGRTAQMPSTYQCMGSGSLLFRLGNGDQRAISLALFHDTTKHRGTSEVNAWIYGWPVSVADPDYTRNVSCHSLRDDVPIKLTIAKDTSVEKSVKITLP